MHKVNQIYHRNKYKLHDIHFSSLFIRDAYKLCETNKKETSWRLEQIKEVVKHLRQEFLVKDKRIQTCTSSHPAVKT